MTKPIVADNKPIPVELVKGKAIYFCTCGRSSNQPFCDGSHSGTELAPIEFIPEKDETGYLCACKHTSNAPFCDGSHSQFGDDEVGS